MKEENRKSLFQGIPVKRISQWPALRQSVLQRLLVKITGFQVINGQLGDQNTSSYIAVCCQKVHAKSV